MAILLVRHGNTTYDKKVDAMLDPPMDDDGVQKLKRTKDFLCDSGYNYPRIVSSPLQRTMLAAHIIANGNHQITPNIAALPWHLGDLQGKLNTLVGPDIDHLLEFPEMRAPHGESYQTFFTRWTNFLSKIMQYSETKREDIVVTTHSRNINALQEFIDGAPLGHVTETTPEASVTLLDRNEYGEWFYDKIWQGN